MQYWVGCDYFRTPVKFQGPDNFVFVGDHRKLCPFFLRFYTPNAAISTNVIREIQMKVAISFNGFLEMFGTVTSFLG